MMTTLARATRFATRSSFACVLLLCTASCGSGTSGSPIAPTAAPAAVTISNFEIALTGAGSSRSYRTSFTMTETGGRTAASVNLIRFGLAANISANADPTSPIRIAPGASVSSGVITINDTTSAAGTVTAVTLTVGWSDESGRPGSVSSAANVSQPPPEPVARTFTLAGVIGDASTLRALRSAAVTARDSTNQSRTVTTDGNGYYSIAPLREGAVSLTITASGYQSTTRSVTLSSDTSYEVLLLPSAAPPPPPPPTNRTRIGAICNDGWLSDATGQGACSSHNGVRCWRYSDGTCTNP